MKIGYFADGPWSHRALELISEASNLQVVFIVPRYDTQDPILKDWADKLNIPYIPKKNVNTPEFLSIMRGFAPDLLVSMSFNQILKKEIIEFAPKKFINCHAGALPFYRGRNPLNWVLINGESKFGITVHYVDEGIDTGDIIKQKTFPITLMDNYQTLLSTAVTECANVLLCALLNIASTKINRVKQENIHPIGSYFGVRTIGDELIDFDWTQKRLFDFVRGISKPGPCARFFVGDQQYAMELVELIPDAPKYIATTGEVVGRSSTGVVVKVGDSTLFVTGISKVINEKLTEVHVPKFKIGTRFKRLGIS